MPKAIIKCDANRVTVRVWLMNRKEKQVGHVSLQTYGEQGIYASLWPSRPVGLLDSTRSPHHHTLEDDVRDEGGEADITIDLYSLDVAEINREYQSFKNSDHNWDLWGSTIFRDKKSRNCSGLVSHLLTLGGIRKLVSLSPVNARNVVKTGSAVAGMYTFAYTIGSTVSVGFGWPVIPALLIMSYGGGKAGSYCGDKISNLLGLRQSMDKTPELAITMTGLPEAAGRALLNLFKVGLITTPNGVADIAKLAQIAESNIYSLVPEGGEEKQAANGKCLVM